MVELAEFPVVTNCVGELLNERQLMDYRAEREACLTWLLAFGKRPDEAVGYAKGTVKPRCYRMDRFYRYVWQNETDGYTLNLQHAHADAWMEHLAHQDYSAAHKRNCVKALKMLYKWFQHEKGMDEWEPEFSFSRDQSSQPRDYLTRDERSAIRSAALEYGSIPTYQNLNPPERDRWKAHLAQRFEKAKADVGPDDWDRANGWKVPSLTWASLDAGLRPIEVERARPGWVDVDNAVLRIPKEQSSKNREHWVVGIRERTADALDRWLAQREAYPMYDDTDALWLTGRGNTFDSSSLIYLLERLCEIAGIETENRNMSWYSIRHSVGTYMVRRIWQLHRHSSATRARKRR